MAVVCSVFTIQHPDGKELTPPLSPTMQCVLNLVFQYFVIYLLLWVYYTIEDFVGLDMSILAAAKDAIESAKATVQFAPMLSVLFIATRMRALQMTQNKGAPQGWVQDGMYLASWAVLIQFMMCLLMPIFTGKKFTPDTLDGAQKTTDKDINAMPGGKAGAIAVTVVRYSALLALLGGVAAVITGAIIMTPETANGRGSIPVITDGTLPVGYARWKGWGDCGDGCAVRCVARSPRRGCNGDHGRHHHDSGDRQRPWLDSGGYGRYASGGPCAPAAGCERHPRGEVDDEGSREDGWRRCGHGQLGG